MFEYNTLRRTLLPSAERLFPSVHFAVKAQQREFAGVIDMNVETARNWFHKQENVYANNLASLKYINVDGERVYERGSYAYRPNGYFSTWQLHIRLFKHGNDSVDETSTSSGSSQGERSQTALYVHWEKSALTNPREHYNSIGYDTDQGKGRLAKFLRQRKATLHTDVERIP